MVVVAPGDASLLPFAGSHESVDGFDDFWRAFFSVLGRPNKKLVLDKLRIIADGNGVVILTKELATFQGVFDSQKSAPIGIVMEFERGKLKRFEDHFDVTAAQESVRTIIHRNTTAREKTAKATSSKQEN